MTPPEIPTAEVPAYRDRKLGLVIFGLLTVLAGFCCVLFMLVVIIGTMLGTRQAQPEIAKASLGWGVGLYGLLAVTLVWLGIGSIMARRWARALLLIWSWAWLIFGVGGLAVAALILPNSLAAAAAHAPNGPPPSLHLVYWSVLGFTGIFSSFCRSSGCSFTGAKMSG